MCNKKEEVEYNQIKKITEFIKSYVMKDEQVVVAVSGGVDSDVVARLCCRSLGNDRVRLFIVVQSEMESKYLENARRLARTLGVSLAEIHLEDMNRKLMQALEEGESAPIFRTNMMLDLAKAKCSVRSSVLSSYQDKGFLIAGTTNRTENELGFFLTFGDNLASFKPIAHLYKSEVIELARLLGTEETVIQQAPSAGFWVGQTDLEDIAYWIVNEGPIVYPREFSPEEQREAEQIMTVLTQKKIDDVLHYDRQKVSADSIAAQVELPTEIVKRLFKIVEKAKILKSRKIMVELTTDGE